MAENNPLKDQSQPNSQQAQNDTGNPPAGNRAQESEMQNRSPEPRLSEGRPADSRLDDEGRPVERPRAEGGRRARGTAAMDPQTRQEVARKGGLAVSRNKQHMAEIGRKGGQTVSKNRDHMANIGRKGGEASRGQR